MGTSEATVYHKKDLGKKFEVKEKEVKEIPEGGRYQGWSKDMQRLTWTNCSSEWDCKNI